MAFNSIVYTLFLSVCAILYYLLPVRFRWAGLLAASIGYYLSFIPVFISILLLVVVINYFLANHLAKVQEKRKGRTLVMAIFINLVILAFFKYFHIFFPQNRISLYNVDWFFRTDPITSMIMPLGLSYILFTVLSYQIELKRNTIQPEQHIGYFSLYLLFFPRVAQGPLERPQQLIPQLHQPHSFDYTLALEGLKQILWGYFKKLVVADRLAIYVDAIYNNSEHHNGTTLIVATFFFAFQIYADFSGYTDIALGSAKIFGINLTGNFKRPYLATSIKEFWNRWHITFSFWLRDYVFLPLAYFLSKRMKKQEYMWVATEKWIYLVASLVTFAICGIWHGEGWNFLVWGLLFGVFLTYSNWTEKLQKQFRKKLHIKKTNWLYLFYKTILTFFLVSFTWIFFRAGSLDNAIAILENMLTSHGSLYIPDAQQLVYCVFGILFLVFVEIVQEFKSKNNLPYISGHWYLEQIAYAVLIIIILTIGVFDGGQFIYFQF